ncbi:MAG: 50S ribosomal protein L6 [Deltaproteobacteria bacterium CG07_land_8_20_14_0_80_38_7]|nr:MAG: 50S ribosomal protein L6 [Deltaproteobacteria bacterium CG07_land_8_20_14_0_80_38_7]
MSRIGKRPVVIPQGVTVKVDGLKVNVKGPKGDLTISIPAWDCIESKVVKEGFVVNRVDDTRQARIGQGLVRALVANMVTGVTVGFKKELDIVGVGYKADVKGSKLNLNLGYSHPIEFDIPKGIQIAVEKQTHLTVNGADKALLGETCARIRRFRPPEPYKGKGIKYTDEVIKRKVGKAAVGATK